MKDIHNHLLYGIDDGSDNYNKSIKILNNLSIEGVTDIVVTPHYIIGSNYNSNNKEKNELIKKLQKKTKIKLYLGNEVYIDNGIIEEIKKGNISTVNNSNYLLIELPLREKLEYAKDIIFDLRNNGIIPIIAHPERYHYLKLDELETFIKMGCLLQGNITSLNNKYGKSAKKNLELLLSKHMIHVLGTDTHNSGNIDLNVCINKLKKIVDDKMYDELVNTNFDKIINNEKIEVYSIISKKGFFKREKFK